MEREFLIELCRPERDKFYSPPLDIDWKQVAYAADIEGLSGFIYSVLKRTKWTTNFKSLNDLKNCYYANISKNLSLFSNLKPVLEYLEDNGITPIVFRGASLMGDVYPSFGMRSFQDIDLLIREIDLFKTINLLKNDGFNSCDPYISVLYTKHINIDLHTDFMTYSRVKPVRLVINTNLDSLFERALEHEVQGAKFLTLHPEDGLLSLAVHLQMHSFDRLLGFLDIARLIDRYRDEIDWERLFEKAKGMNLERTLYYSLSLMPEGWRAFDDSIIERLSPHLFHYGEKPLLERLKKGQKIPYSGDTLFFLSPKGLWKKIRFLKGVLFPEEEVGLKTLLNPFLALRFLMGRLMKIGRFFFGATLRSIGGTHG